MDRKALRIPHGMPFFFSIFFSVRKIFQKYQADVLQGWRFSLILIISICAIFGSQAIASQQTKSTSVVRKTSPVDEPGVARFVRDENGVSIIEFAGAYDRSLQRPRETIAKEFYKTHADVYDFLVVFSSFEFPTADEKGGDALAFYNPVRNDTQGIGLELERVMNSALPDVNCCDGKKQGIPNRRQR